MEGFNRILNKYLNLPHPNIFKFVDHLKTLDADMILKFTEFKSNPLDYSKYTKASKQVKDEFRLQRLKDSFNDGSLTLADYMYAVAESRAKPNKEQ